MRLWILALNGALGLWGLMKLSQSHVYRDWYEVWVGESCGRLAWVDLQLTGRGYDLVRTNAALRDTFPLGRLCKGLLLQSVKIQRSVVLDSLCARLHLQAYHPEIEWVLPEGHDWVEPWQWVQDEIWSCGDLPSHRVTIAAKPGLHLYPVILPRGWGVYPETLWVKGHLAAYSWMYYRIRPRVIGNTGYRVLLSPSVIEVQFQVPQKLIKQISPNDIDVIVDMRKVLPQDTVAYVQVRSRVPFTRNLRFRPQGVRFTRVYS
jgi:hypothetical protein